MSVSDKSGSSSRPRRVPQQVTHLALVFLIAAVAYVIARSFLVPPTFGELGHYRADAVREIAARPIKYAGKDACVACHEEESTQQYKGPHQNVSCEDCHGPSQAHADNFAEAPKPVKPAEREYCPYCHGYDGARPNGFPQVDAATHNEGLPCTGCHNPHQADLPSVPETCAACHGRTSRLMAASLHASMACTDCHQSTDEHKKTPRLIQPATSLTREACGTCHAKGAPGHDDAVRVDMAAHNTKNACWQCHYPHDPEVKK
jgi:hypothetical protein